MTTVIETHNLSHDYGDFRALKDMNLTVTKGEIFGFLGPNGAGKTTAIRTLLDFIRPTTGSATVLSMDSVRDSVAIKARVGYLPSELKLWDNWTGVQYIRWLEGVRNATFLQEAERLAGALQFDLKRSLAGMSTGMKRKMGLIATLAHKPELLILDEPTTGLDPLMQQVFNDLMKEIRAEGRTVFLSSHMLTEVEQICDRIGIIREGELRDVQTIADLTSVKFRWMTLTFAEPISHLNGFGALQGISEIAAEGNRLRMKVSGEASMDAIIKQAAQHTVQDLRFEQPNLEEIFLAYYG